MNVRALLLIASVWLAAASAGWAKASDGTVGGEPAPAGAIFSQHDRSVVPLIGQGSALMVRGTVNGKTAFTFEIDTGASIAVIPRSVAAGLITAADYLGAREYVFGDGRRRIQPTYRLHSITVGGLTATDVPCVIGEEADIFLLGRTFLQQFRSWSIDNRRHVLVLEL
jgi:hypothetical protein